MPISLQDATGDHFRQLQREALADYERTGVPHCIIELEKDAPQVVLPETEVVAGGLALINSILWSTDTADADGLDPALLA